MGKGEMRATGTPGCAALWQLFWRNSAVLLVLCLQWLYRPQGSECSLWDVEAEDSCVWRCGRCWACWRTCCSSADLHRLGLLLGVLRSLKHPRTQCIWFVGPLPRAQERCSCIMWHGVQTRRYSDVPNVWMIDFVPRHFSRDLVLSLPPEVSHSISAR